MKKIAIIGAGIGGLHTAYELGKAGYDVEVYEKEKEGQLGYEWHDDVAPAIFRKLDISLPSEEFYQQKADWTFVPPNSQKYVFVKTIGERDVSIYRRELSNIMAKRAKEYAQIFYEKKVQSLIIKDNIVVGIKVEDKDMLCDLVVDCSGALSKFRSSLPENYNIQAQPESGEVFFAFRGFFERKVTGEDNINKAYLKHLGEAGLSWCRNEFENEVDVLVGRVDELQKITLENAINELRKDNFSMGEKLLHGGVVCAIPVRYPLTKMVGDGYVAIGDAAFMTIPLMGSGIECSLLAADILTKTIIRGGLSKENLYRYQVEYFLQTGAKNMGVDVLKRWLLNTPSDDIRFLFEKGIISENELAISGSGGLIKLSLKELIKKLIAGYKKIGLLLKLKTIVKKMQKAVEIGKNIPSEYNEEGLNEWQQKVKNIFIDL